MKNDTQAPYRVVDVCRYIVHYTYDTQPISVSYLQLLKLLYFVQAYFLITTGNPCFKEKIIAHSYGPYIEEVHQEYGMYGGMMIWPRKTYLEKTPSASWGIKEVEYKEDTIAKKDRERIAEVVNRFSGYCNSDMAKIIWNQRPWKAAYNKENNNWKREITNQSLLEYFADDN